MIKLVLRDEFIVIEMKITGWFDNNLKISMFRIFKDIKERYLFLKNKKLWNKSS